VLAQDDLAGREQPVLLPEAQRHGGLGQGGAGFHFNDRKDAGLFRHGIDLPRLGADTPGEDRPAIVPQGRAGGLLGGKAAGIRSPVSPAAHRHRPMMAAEV
jgi:hypothetical protein